LLAVEIVPSLDTLPSTLPLLFCHSWRLAVCEGAPRTTTVLVDEVGETATMFPVKSESLLGTQMADIGLPLVIFSVAYLRVQ
jgi:hypothetical protein